MRYKPYTEIESVSAELVDEAVKKIGVPDNFVEAATGTIVGLPDLNRAGEAHDLVARLERKVASLGAAAVDGDEIGERADDAPGGASLPDEG